MNFFEIKDGALFFKRRQEIMEICPWGAGLRVRATQNRSFSHKNWALDIPAKKEGNIEIFDDYAVVKNGNIYADVTDFGRISFYNEKDELLLKEYYNHREN